MAFDQWPRVWTERLEALDWSGSPFGPPERWPAKLRMALGIIFSSPAPKLVLWGKEGATFCNDAYHQLVGGRITVEDTGRPFSELLPPAWELIKADVARAMAGELLVSGEFLLRLQTAEAEGFYFQTFYTPLLVAEDRIGGVLVDSHATLPSRLFDTLLLSEHAPLNRLLNDSPAFIALGVGPRLELEFVNRAATRLFGKREGAGVAQRRETAAGRWLASIMREVCDSGEQRGGVDLPIAVFEPDATGHDVQFIDFVCQPVRDDNDRIFGAIFTGFDATERIRAREAADREQHQRLHLSRLEAMGTMAMTLAHELNQPLAAVGNYLNAALIAGAGEVGAMKIDLVRSALAEVTRAGDVIRRARSLVRLGVADRGEATLGEAIDGAVSLLEASGCEGLEVLVDDGAGAVRVLADPVQLEQVFVNLLRNAWTASRDASVRRVDIAALSLAGRRVRIEVRDFGTGFSERRVSHPFADLGKTGSDGLGVGLALCRTLIEANRGTIVPGNAASGGALVVLELDAAGEPTG